jgi:hypothetical protein
LDQIPVVILRGKLILDTAEATEAVLVDLAHLDRFVAILAKHFLTEQINWPN